MNTGSRVLDFATRVHRGNLVTDGGTGSSYRQEPIPVTGITKVKRKRVVKNSVIFYDTCICAKVFVTSICTNLPSHCSSDRWVIFSSFICE